MFKPKVKKCQNCQKDFRIEPEDFEFYQKIDVPEPSWCFNCRLQRKTAFLANRKFHKRKCDFSGKEIVSIFHPDSPFKVYDQKIWHSDKWDPMEYGQDYDFSKPFFEQFKRLMERVPWANLSISDSVNCDYCHAIVDSKDCYLTSGYRAENCFYLDTAILSRDCSDSLILVKAERAYGSVDCDDCYNIAFCVYCDNCLDSSFLYNCRNCQSCFGCVNLKNKQYHIFNKSYTKENYYKEIKKYDLASYRTLLEVKEKFQNFYLKFPRPWAKITKSVNVIGDDVRYSKNCHYCFMVKDGAEDCKYLYWSGLSLKDSYDICTGGAKSELCYESSGIMKAKNILFSNRLHYCFDSSYSIDCFNSSNLFGCIGLRHKKYCVLNKQYTKESFDKLRIKIIRQMNQMPYKDKKGLVYKYGEFFPIEMSRYGYNESWAQLYYYLNKQQALKQGYNWHNKVKMEYQSTIKAQNLPDNIKKTDKSILKEIIECGNVRSDCAGSGVFRIIPAELELYKKMNLALPRLCPDCRYRDLLKLKNPPKLWHRQCMNKGCTNEFETSYAPDRPEIVYCEECYNKEVG